MKKLLLHIWIVAATVCLVSATHESARAQMVPAISSQQEVKVEADRSGRGWNENRQHPIGNTFIGINHSQRVGSSRTPRSSSSNGGNSGRELYLPKTNYKYNLLNYALLLLRYDSSGSQMEAESPRLYYVIALRHILC